MPEKFISMAQNSRREVNLLPVPIQPDCTTAVLQPLIMLKQHRVTRWFRPIVLLILTGTLVHLHTIGMTVTLGMEVQELGIAHHRNWAFSVLPRLQSRLYQAQQRFLH